MSVPKTLRSGAGILVAGCALGALGGLGGLGALGWAALAPVTSATRDAVFEIPKGTWARRMSGDPVEILPDAIHLTLGVQDVLVLKNQDDVPQMFGPTLMMPGQSFRLPFAVASSYVFACTAHASGQMTIVVEPFPDGPWERLRWRVGALLRLRREALQRGSSGAPAGEDGST